ncbi:hypothetical protein RhiJN_14226 [Ceratobasidium sp. AG-Ba]|nr:hypothetical protein RhiJN_14226 [Ceratobasidium sp. AG-Ba]
MLRKESPITCALSPPSMDIISPPRFGGRKRSWADEQLERPYKRATCGRTRERPLCPPLLQQITNIQLQVNTQPEDVAMTNANESQHQDAVQGIPTQTTSEPFVPFGLYPDPQIHPPSAGALPSNNPPGTVQLLSMPTKALPGSNVKKRFAIGPRSNCERCLSGEPGHYGHWL